MFKFDLLNGSDKEVVIYGDFFDDEAVAKERAIAEFVENSFVAKQVTFNTYLTNIYVGMHIEYLGLIYKVVDVGIAVDKVKIISTVTGARYEN